MLRKLKIKKTKNVDLHMTARKRKLSTGDYVQVIDSVHDVRMPHNRRDGLVVEVLGRRNDQFIVMFCNNSFLKFHGSQLNLLEKLPTKI